MATKLRCYQAVHVDGRYDDSSVTFLVVASTLPDVQKVMAKAIEKGRFGSYTDGSYIDALSAAEAIVSAETLDPAKSSDRTVWAQPWTELEALVHPRKRGVEVM